MRRWFRTRAKVAAVRPVREPLSTVLAECAGHWIAVDRATNKLLAAAPTADALAVQVREQRLRGVAIMRAPDPSEPELVGLG